MDEVKAKPKTRKSKKKNKNNQDSVVAPNCIVSQPSELRRGVTYKGSVIKTFPYRFIVLVHDRFRVLVHNQRFLPLGNQRDVLAHCVVAEGDEVFITAIKNNNISKYNEEWLAEKCWIEKSVANCAPNSCMKDMFAYNGIVSRILPTELNLGSPPQVIVVIPANCIILHGYHVGSLNLTDIFRIGDLLHYEIASSSSLNDGIVCAKQAWYGSFSRNNSGMCTELLNFCASRALSKEVLIALSMAQLDKDPHNPDKDLDEDDFRLELKYIKPQNDQSEKHRLNINKRAPQSLHKKVLQPANDYKDFIVMKAANEVHISNRFDVLSLSEPEDFPEVANTGTQTYSTGEIFNIIDFPHDA